MLTSSPPESLATDPAKTGVKPVQVLQLDLDSAVLDDIVKNVLVHGKELRLACGKTTVGCSSCSMTFSTKMLMLRASVVTSICQQITSALQYTNSFS